MRRILLAALMFGFCLTVVAQQQMNNDAVIKLVKAGLSDDLIVSTISASPGAYDTSVDGLVALKTAGASDKVITAIVLKSSGVGTAAPVASSNGLPPGIDEIGVYYKDRNGAWVALMPEVVNFKTGGALKSLASAGVVKGDVNGHVQGPRAKVTLQFPVMLAIYVPAGVAITEYQLLRYRANSDSREFRSITGGVMHVSGGATRDTLDFQTDKLAPRLYQLTLQGALGKGEYGLLPPGAFGSANLGSSGKVYSISVQE